MAIDDSDARHFLGRVGFVPDDAEVEHFAGREIHDVVEEVTSGIPDAPLEPVWLDIAQQWKANRKNIDWWLNRMASSTWTNRDLSTPHPLVEKMTLFWHSHFATGYRKVSSARIMFEQNQILRVGALGPFENLCRDISLHGATLRYLDNQSNIAGRVQENFARELMELYTTGVGHYTEFDVVEVARAWTGHGTVGWVPAEERYDGTYKFHPDRHDYDPKTIFGITKNWDGPEVITELCLGVRKEQTSNFLATKLWRFFVHDHPSAAHIATVAQALQSSDLTIQTALRAVLAHPEMWDRANRRSLVKSPVQFVVDFNRCTGRTFTDDAPAVWWLGGMGQVPFEPPNVDGWGINDFWLSTATMWARAKFAGDTRWSLTNETDFLSELSTMTAQQASDHLVDVFRINEPSPGTIAAFEDWFTRTKADHEWALPPSAITVAATAPEFQVI